MHGDERGSVDRPALARLLSTTPEAFAAEYWGSRPLFARAAELAGGFADLFTADAVDELVTRRALRTPFVRMANEGSVLKPSRYTAPGRRWPSSPASSSATSVTRPR